jgi:hypothetical protein
MLHAEFNAGQEILTDLETRQADVRNTLVRMSGAIQVLEELLTQQETSSELKPDAVSETATAVAA